MKSDKTSTITSVTKVLFLLTFISIIFNFMLLSEITENKNTYAFAMNEYHEKKEELNTKLNAADQIIEKEFDRYYSDKLQRLMDEEELLILAQEQWNYILTMNGKVINNRTISTEDRYIKIALVELSDKEKILPEDILIKGSLIGGDPNDSLDHYIDVVALPEFTKYEVQEKSGKRICYDFKNIENATIITIKLSEILTNRLGIQDQMVIEDNLIEIIVR